MNNKITKEDLLKGLDKIVPSISIKDKEKYENVLLLLFKLNKKVNFS